MFEPLPQQAGSRKVPERLLEATAGAAVRLSQREAVPADGLSEHVLELVKETLKALNRQSGKPDTALWLCRRLGEDRHGLS